MHIGLSAASGKYGVIPEPDIWDCDGVYEEHKCWICANEQECMKEQEDEE